MHLEKRTNSIRHQTILIAPEQGSAPSPVRRYRAGTPWPVAGLAAAAAAGAVLLTGGLATAFDGGEQSVAAPMLAAGARVPIETEERAAPTSVMMRSPRSTAAPETEAGLWKIQVGAFQRPSAALEHLSALKGRVFELAELADAPHATGGMTRARFGGIADEESARRLCGRVADAGGRCFVVAPGG
ncbi:SPOR domain-containing protein [Allosphingosinicella sp.]|uniref:SPOR domain-containing protein n=1 Tax=Allosphingosinicella sp. TaxID=2823234 RepID=UPI002EDE7DA0